MELRANRVLLDKPEAVSSRNQLEIQIIAGDWAQKIRQMILILNKARERCPREKSMHSYC